MLPDNPSHTTAAPEPIDPSEVVQDGPIDWALDVPIPFVPVEARCSDVDPRSVVP